MDHLYSVFNNDNIQTFHKHFLEDGNSNIVSSLSNNNILAFTSDFDLLEQSDWNGEYNQLETNVYVVDLNIPYYPYRVMKHTENISVLEWDYKGTKLLIGDETGNIEIWSMKDFLISDWQRFERYSHSFSGDRIIAGIWFHNGQKIMINYDKKDLDVPYQEKITFKRIQPSVVQFGNKHTDGYLCITASGLVYVHLFCPDGKIINGSEFLDNRRMSIAQIDVAYMKDGSFLVISTNGDALKPIFCYTIQISLDHLIDNQPELKINCQSFTSFNLECALLKGPSSPGIIQYPNVSRLKFIVKECPDAAVVVASGKNGSIIELWELCDKPVTFHNVFKNLSISKIDQRIMEQKWQFNTSTSNKSFVCALSTPTSLLFETNPPLSYIIVAYTDKTIKCFYRENLQTLVTVDLQTALTVNFNTNNTGRQREHLIGLMEVSRKLSIIRDIKLSWSSCAMIAIDSFSQLHFFRLSPMIEPCNQMSLNFAQLILEYSLISGHDYWDILISIKPQFIETLCEKISDNFTGSRQPQHIQQKWFDKILQLKAALYRCAHSGPLSYKCGDFYAMKMLNAISETIKRLIRAREYQENEGPAEKLSYIIQTKPTNDFQQFLNIDKILLKLDNKDFCVESAIKQLFQHLLQWVCDLALYLLASIPQRFYRPQFRIPGSGLLSDVKSLNTLRELLVIIRFWSLIDSGYVPSFNKMHEIDVIALVYKLLSKLVLSPEKIEESIVDECCILPNQVMINQMDLCLKSIGVASPALFSNQLPLILHYGVEPSTLKYTVKVPLIDGAFNIHGNRRIDVLRYISLGHVNESTNELIRSCTRCNSVSLIKSPTRYPAARAWDQQWVKKCVCGGSWRVHATKNSMIANDMNNLMNIPF